MFGLSEFTTKLIVIGVLAAAILFGVHKYNEALRAEGEARVAKQWSGATVAMKAQWDEDRRVLTLAKEGLSKQYNAERDTRLAIQARNDEEREDAIRRSNVAGLVCIDDRMRDSWNRANGYDVGPAGVRKP